MLPLKHGLSSALRSWTLSARLPPKMATKTATSPAAAARVLHRCYAATSTRRKEMKNSSSSDDANGPAKPLTGNRIAELLGVASDNLLAEESAKAGSSSAPTTPNPFVVDSQSLEADKKVLDDIAGFAPHAAAGGRRGATIAPAPLAPTNPGAAAGNAASARVARRLFGPRDSANVGGSSVLPEPARYRLYVLAKRMNCIMTLVDAQGKVVAWSSGGRCGFKGVGEGTYEAGYQCAVRMLDAVRREIQKHDEARHKRRVELEILMRGFGQGRTAILKALTLPEGDRVREVVYCLTDRTQIKIGGVRLQKARRM